MEGLMQKVMLITMKKLNNVITVFFALSCLMTFFTCSNNKTIIYKAKKIKVGMNMEDVKNILGVPYDSIKGYTDSSQIMFLYSAPQFESDDIQIYFDAETKQVDHIVLPKGYN